MQRAYFSCVKNVDHEALWPALMSVVCRSGAHAPATSTLRESFRHLEVQSTFMLWRKSERLVTEMSLMEKRSILNAHLPCVEVCERNVLCEFLSLRDIAKRLLLRAA